MRTINRKFFVVFTALAIFFTFTEGVMSFAAQRDGSNESAQGNLNQINQSNQNDQSDQSNQVIAYSSYRDIPGVTDDEIAAVEALRERRVEFVYGMLPSTEAFYDEHGDIKGYSALFCGWLTELFGVPFRPVIREMPDILAGLRNGELDFSGELTATPARREIYFMTDAIASRTLKQFRLAGLSETAASPRRYCFLRGSNTVNTVTAGLAPGTFEVVYADSISEVYGLLKAGKIDSFFYTAPVEINFDQYHDVVSENIFPLIYRPVSMSAQNPDYEAVISVVQKALESGAALHLSKLYDLGYYDYLIHKLFTRLTGRERAYIRSAGAVLIAADPANYPISFYNIHEEQWQGAAFDVLDEVRTLTGLSFKLTGDRHSTRPTLIKSLEDGEVSMITEPMRSWDLPERFLSPGKPIMTDNYALISKADFHYVSVNEILYAKIGMVANSKYAALFKLWYPTHPHVVEYENFDEALEALERGEIDLLMASMRWLLYITNFHETAGYKANYMFNRTAQSVFGFFNKDDDVLCSIVDKALGLIDTANISSRWLSKTYDYRLKLAQARLPWSVGVSAMLAAVLIMAGIMLQRNRTNEIRLRKLVEERTEELTKQAMTLNTMLDCIPDQIFCKDLDGHYTRMNKSMERHFGVSEKDVIGKGNKEALNVSDEIAAFFDNMDSKILNENVPYLSYEQYAPSADGRDAILHAVKVPLLQDGRVMGVLGICRDITQRKAMEEEAKAASRSKSAFLANMSHEIRTPMNAILGITEIQLQDDKLAPNMREVFGRIYSSGDLLLGIINDILDFSKIEAGKLELAVAKYEVASLINDTMQLNAMRIGSKQIGFELSIDENMPSALIGDELRVKQILNNLLSNAFKYTAEGKVKLSVSHAGGALLLSVSDTGQGMTEEQLNKIFDAYSRFNMKTNRTIEGTGLGMSITRSLVDLMNGEIHVESELGRGTVFTVRLPQKNAGSPALGREIIGNLLQYKLGSKTYMRRAQITREPMPYGTVLIVDDVEVNIYVAKGLLAPYGLTIDSAYSGFEAIEKIKAGSVYDIVFMDHMMPKMDGLEATRILRDMGYAYPIVALTANAVMGQMEMFLSNGFDEFISKPIDIREMNAVLNKLIRDKQPPEVIEAARRQNGGAKPPESAPAGEQRVNPRLAEIFARDASRVIAVLETLYGKHEKDDVRMYTINVHAMKSALANIGEYELSACALRLEHAGLENDFAVMDAETPLFLKTLRSVIEKNSPQAPASPEGEARAESEAELTAEERSYIREKLLEVKAACAVYDKKTAKSAIAGLEDKARESQKTRRGWPRRIEETLAAVSEHLLTGDFDEAMKAIDEALT